MKYPTCKGWFCYIFEALPHMGICTRDSSIFWSVIILNGFYFEKFLSQRVIIPKFLSQRVIIPKIFIPKGHYTQFVE